MKGKFYCAMIGDIIGSRQIPRAGLVQKQFEKAIEVVNKTFPDVILSKFLVAEGDDFQGLLNSAAGSYTIARRIQHEMGKVPMRFGIGIGSLDTPIKDFAIGMNGEAFHRARAALIYAKEQAKKIVYDYNNPAAKFVNSIIEILDQLMADVSKQSLDIYRMSKCNISQSQIAHEMHISQQAVSKILKSKKIRQIMGIEESINTYLKQPNLVV